jgi:hypothetical protein
MKQDWGHPGTPFGGPRKSTPRNRPGGAPDCWNSPGGSVFELDPAVGVFPGVKRTSSKIVLCGVAYFMLAVLETIFDFYLGPPPPGGPRGGSALSVP